MPLPTTGAGRASLAPNFSTSIVGYWRLGEASGTRADSSGNGWTLTDNNSVLSQPGKVGSTAADFEATNSESLSRADNAAFEVGSSSWSACGWFNVESAGTTMGLLGKMDWSAVRGYYIGFNASSKPIVETFDATLTATVVHSTAALSLATWYFVAGGFDAVQQKSWVSLNGGAKEYSAATGGTMNIPDGTYSFRIGWIANGGAGQYFDGLEEQWGLWIGRILSDAEITYIYNSGTGRQLF